ncbi:MAG: sigma-70 family RNA polymerase sigma factor [Actinobacteria bacterium]|nr:sigma-70 family RNA polymerase sigma factor [Actinomycetota bacterium]MBS1884703.1 sigma-70 family RNA polymerase sigma factor [Actinomycetota bacterium]
MEASPERPSSRVGEDGFSAEASAFYTQVYGPARKGCLNELRKAGCSEEEAEELFAASFENIMRTVDPIARSFAVPQMVNFVKRAAWRAMIDERRRLGRRIEVELGTVQSITDAGAESPDEAAEEREAVAMGREALQMLPERDRLIFCLRHEMDLSPEEILERTPGLSLRTYRKIIQRANSRVLSAFARIEAGERCEEMESGLLRRYVSEACGEAEQAAVEVHLAHCRRCQVAHARLRGHLLDVACGLAITATASAGVRAHADRIVDAMARILDAGQGLVAGTKAIRDRLREQALRAATSVPGSGGDAAAGQVIGASAVKVAAGCVAGAAATTAACVALGVSPLAVVGVTHEAPAPRPPERKAERRPTRRVVTPPSAVDHEWVEAPVEPATPAPTPPAPKPRKSSGEPSHHESATKREAVHRASAAGGELVEGLEGAGRAPSGVESEPAPESGEAAASASSSSATGSSAGSGGTSSGGGGSGGGGAPVDGGAELGL